MDDKRGKRGGGRAGVEWQPPTVPVPGQSQGSKTAREEGQKKEGEGARLIRISARGLEKEKKKKD